MAFPQTQLTLIQRLSSGGSDEDWRRFLADYWGPLCRFALHWGAKNLDDAEEVASHTLAVIWENRLLDHWMSNRSAKLRSLLCAVVRNVLSNSSRAQAGRQRISEELLRRLEECSQARDEQSDAFYAAWVDDLIQQVVESLAAEYYRKNQGDYVRVLYGRLCERLTIAEVAEALALQPSTVDYYFRHARQRLSEKLKTVLRPQVERYCPPEEAEHEFHREWELLGRFLTDHGGLEEAVRRAYDTLDPVRTRQRRAAGLTQALAQLTAIRRSSPDVNNSRKITYGP
ncbi:MAG: RNA polymerase sigma factor [Thermoguttaceae bacterium]